MSRTAFSAESSASSRGVFGLSRAGTCGLDPVAGEVLAVGQEEAPDGEVERAAVLQRLDLLEDALAEGLLAHHGGAVVVAQRAGHDLGGAGRAAVNQHGHRDVGGDGAAGGVQLLLRAVAPVGRDDQALVHEDAGHQPPLLEQPAAVAAQVEHDALRALSQQPVDLLAELGVRAVGEGGQLGHPDLRAAHGGHVTLRHRHVDAGALDGDGARRRPPLRGDRERDGGARLALDLVAGRRAAAPAIDWPLTFTITSPLWIPAAAAGEPANTLTTPRPCLVGFTEMPMPSNWPFTCWSNDFVSLGVK